MGRLFLESEECAELFNRVAYESAFEIHSLATPPFMCALCETTPAPRNVHDLNAIASWAASARATSGSLHWLTGRPALQDRSLKSPLAERDGCVCCESQLAVTVLIPSQTLRRIYDSLSREEQEFLSTFTVATCGICRDLDISPRIAPSILLDRYANAHGMAGYFETSPGQHTWRRISAAIESENALLTG